MTPTEAALNCSTLRQGNSPNAGGLGGATPPAEGRGDVGTSPHQEPSSPQPLSLDPTNPFEIVLAEQIRHLRADVDRLNTRLNWLFTLIIGAAVTNVLLAILQ